MKKGDSIFLTIAGFLISIFLFNDVMFYDYSNEELFVSIIASILLFAGLPWSIYRIITHLKSKKIKNALQHS